MATYKAVANGNWSALATWQDNSTGSYVASTVLPGVNDDVYANAFVVQVDQNINIKSLRNQTATSITEKGRFEIGTTRTVTTVDGIFGASTNYGTTGASNGCLYVKTAGIIATINSHATGGSGNYCYAIASDVAATLIITGNQIGGAGSIAAGLCVQGNTNVTITGNQSGSAGSGIYHLVSSSGTYNITGNQSSMGINASTAATWTIIGNQTAGSFHAIQASSASTFTITGVCTASSSLPAIYATVSTTQIIYTGQIYNVNGTNAIWAAKLYLNINSSTQYRFYDFSGTINTLYPAGVGTGNPSVGDVRLGTVYGPSSSLTGTLIVPSPSNVRKGVGTDNTIGTAEVTGEDIITAINSSSNPLAERLRNVATVQTTGDQIAALNTEE